MKLGVIGSPIAHSKSPAMHRAAFTALGLRWTYEPHDVTRETFPEFAAQLNGLWRGVSVTAPLKELAYEWAHDHDEDAALTGVANTLLLPSKRGFNTDVTGIVAAFRLVGLAASAHGGIVGGGATAMSALVALHRMGADTVSVRARSLQKLGPMRTLADRLGITLAAAELSAPIIGCDAVVSTLPASASVIPVIESPTAILDADYAKGYSRYELDHEDRIVSGVEMLVAQALAQVRIFVGGDPDRALPNEGSVWRSMRHAAGIE